MKYCSTCGKELQEDMQFCPGCGTPVQMTTEPKPDETFFAEELTPKKKHKGIVAIIIVIMLMIIVTTTVTTILSWFNIELRQIDLLR